MQGGGTYASAVSWFSVGSLHVEVGQYIDGLAAVMIVVVTAVSLSVHVYSLGYMDGDVRFTWFYVVLSLFTAAMLNVVIAPNLIQLLVGWEIMGVCSYLLIGHWYEVKENSNAAIKAFITTRIGDVPMLFGIFALIFATGFTTSNITAIGDLVASHQVSSGLVAAAALLLFGGTIGKSAQFPLHVWLPDAMAGPTPVSALIHAATMVAAGVYLVGRMYTVFINAEPWVLQVVGIVGAITMLGAALMALVQEDIKRVLAYSTVSQLAYMVAAMSLGPAGRNAAFFHLFTHAFFKALLFLGAGSVIHAVHSNDMSDMGGLRKPMPVTFWTFLIGSAALAGIAPLAGFWSKDELLVTASDGHGLLFAVMLVTAALTAFYTTRMVVRTFFGTYEGHGASARVAAQHGRAARLPGRPARSSSGSSARRSCTRRSSSGSSTGSRRRSTSRRGSPSSERSRPSAASCSRGGCTRRGRSATRCTRSVRCGVCSSGSSTSTTSTWRSSCIPFATSCPRPCTGSTSTSSTPS